MSLSREADLAYAAGLFDGEGSIMGRIILGKSSQIVATIVMCDLDGIEVMSNLFGGCVYTHKRKTCTGRAVYSWTLYSKKAANALEQMLPYLRIKSSRARLAIELARMTRCRGGHNSVPPDEMILRKEIAAKIKAENNGVAMPVVNMELNDAA